MIVQSHATGTDAWLIVAGPTSLLALPETESGRIPELRARLAGADGFRAALESLVGNGIAGAPPFALLDGDGAVLRAVLRGDAAVTAPGAGSEVVFSGAGMATWTERVLEGTSAVQLSVPGSTWIVTLDASTTPAGEAAVVASPPSAPAEDTLVPRAADDPPTVEPPTDGPPTDGPPAVDPRASSEAEAYDFLFGDTIYRTQAGASIRIPNPDPERPGDRDGHTLLADQGERVEHAPSLRVAPALQLERADGSRESLGRPVLIGRSPTASGSSPEARVVMITDDPDISRSHLRVAVEGDVVVVTDLGSKNGSVITLPGAAPRKLRASEPTVVLPGTLIDLGGGTTFTVREDEHP